MKDIPSISHSINQLVKPCGKLTYRMKGRDTRRTTFPKVYVREEIYISNFILMRPVQRKTTKTT